MTPSCSRDRSSRGAPAPRIGQAARVASALGLGVVALVVVATAHPASGRAALPDLTSRASAQASSTISGFDARAQDFPPVEARMEAIRSSRGGVRPAAEVAPPASPQEAFIQAAASAARTSQAATRVPASVTIAQAILESGWGKYTIGGANNYFGIKADSGPGPAGVVLAPTQEVIGGVRVTVQARFRAYNSMAESFVDHGRFLLENPRYAVAFQHAGDPRQFARDIHRAGYATAPDYAQQLISLMDQYDLYQYDLAG